MLCVCYNELKQSDSVSAGQTCVCSLTGISSSGKFKTIYHNGNFFVVIWREKILKYHWNNSTYFEMSASLF